MKHRTLVLLASAGLLLLASNAGAQEIPPPLTAPAPNVTVVPAPVAPMPPANAAGTVRIHVHGHGNKKGARLYLRRGDGLYSLVCEAPCTADVPTGSELRATWNNNDDEPHTFTVPGDAGPEVDIEVRPASVGPLIGGIILMGAGGAIALSGLLFVALADVRNDNNGYSQSYNDRNSEQLRTTGYVCLGLGAAAAVVGLVLLTTRSKEPRIEGTPYLRPLANREDTLLGDVALAKPRDPQWISGRSFVAPLRFSF